MIRYPQEQDLLQKFGRNSKIAGVIFLILGLISLIFPPIMSITTAILFGWLLLISAITGTIHIWGTNPKDILGWLKSFIYLVTGGLILVWPGLGVAALGIVLVVYFLMDSFSSSVLIFELKGAPGRWLVALNAVISAAFAIFILAKWPISAMWAVGLMVGISLFIDGIVLLALGSFSKKLLDL